MTVKITYLIEETMGYCRQLNTSASYFGEELIIYESIKNKIELRYTLH